MKKKLVSILPFVILPISIPVYCILDNLLLVEIFGCGCVPSVQTNMLNIPFNANDLRQTVFSILTIGLSVWSMIIAKRFTKPYSKVLYPLAVALLNVALTLWIIKTCMWV